MTENVYLHRPGDEHRRCCRQDGWPRVGSVRRCSHGRLQLGIPVMGATFAWWTDLSPVWNPVLYQRARRALRRAA